MPCVYRLTTTSSPDERARTSRRKSRGEESAEAGLAWAASCGRSGMRCSKAVQVGASLLESVVAVERRGSELDDDGDGGERSAPLAHSTVLSSTERLQSPPQARHPAPAHHGRLARCPPRALAPAPDVDLARRRRPPLHPARPRPDRGAEQAHRRQEPQGGRPHGQRVRRRLSPLSLASAGERGCAAGDEAVALVQRGSERAHSSYTRPYTPHAAPAASESPR